MLDLRDDPKLLVRPTLRVSAATVLVAFLVTATVSANSYQPQHPLDPLTISEHWLIFEILKTSGKVDGDTRYTLIDLQEPPKAEVLSWQPKDSFRREAFVIVKQGDRTFEAVIDLTQSEVSSWREVEGVQPNLIWEEVRAAEELVKNDPRWQKAMRKRGITSFETVSCGPISPGDFEIPSERGRRLGRVHCRELRGSSNSLGRPIEGLVVVVDLNRQEILDVLDFGVVPLPDQGPNYDPEAIGPTREVPTPLDLEQPVGPSFEVDGHQVSWQNWNFHFRVDPRVGLVVSTVHYTDGERERSVLYRGSLSEIFVPYMDPSAGYYYVTYLDSGEVSALGFASPLERGTDCPDNARYFDTVIADEWGKPRPLPRAACLFERYAGDPAWRHHDAEIHHTESRRQRDLVLRMIATLGNYDYLFDWVFLQNGAIQVRVGATGIDNVKAVAARSAASPSGAQDSRYGRFIAENLVAIYHDHFFSLRLDLDVDGVTNSLQRDRLEMVELEKGPRKSIWTVESEIVDSEAGAKLRIDYARPSLWRVINSASIGPLGYPASYQIKPAGNAYSILAADSPTQRRAGFSAYQLWVTPYRPDELYAAGLYPLQKQGGGLPTWTAADRKIADTDIVVWYTVGFHHVPRAEDWPVMPTTWQQVEVRPFDFFDRSPAIDLPPEN